jgi:hypothetical protein
MWGAWGGAVLRGKGNKTSGALSTSNGEGGQHPG